MGHQGSSDFWKTLEDVCMPIFNSFPFCFLKLVLTLNNFSDLLPFEAAVPAASVWRICKSENKGFKKGLLTP